MSRVRVCVCVLRVSVRAAVEAERWCLECPALFVHEKEKGNQSCIFSIDSSRRMMCSNSNAAASSAVETLSATFRKVWGCVCVWGGGVRKHPQTSPPSLKVWRPLISIRLTEGRSCDLPSLPSAPRSITTSALRIVLRWFPRQLSGTCVQGGMTSAEWKNMKQKKRNRSFS